MASKYLINNIVLHGVGWVYAGSTIPDEQQTDVQNAGGVLWATGDVTVDAAAAHALTEKLRGASPDFLESIMQSAVQKSQSTSIAGQDTVGGTVATNNSTTATNNSITLKRQEHLADLLVMGTAYHAQYAGGAAINDATGPWTMPLPRRTVEVVLGTSGANPVNVTITGTASDGSALTDVIACAGVGTYQGVKAFETITSVTSDVDPVGTVDIKTGKGFAVAEPFATLDALSVNGVVESASSSHAASGTVVPTTSPDSAKDFTVRYQVSHTHVQPSHTHTQASHTHALS